MYKLRVQKAKKVPDYFWKMPDTEEIRRIMPLSEGTKFMNISRCFRRREQGRLKRTMERKIKV